MLHLLYTKKCVAGTKKHIAASGILLTILTINMADITWKILVTATHFSVWVYKLQHNISVNLTDISVLFTAFL